MPVSTPKYKNLFCQTLKKQVLIRGFLLYRDDIFDLWTQGTTKLKEFTEFINSLYPTIKFTMVSSEISLNVLDLTVLLVDGFIQTDIYSKPTDHHI